VPNKYKSLSIVLLLLFGPLYFSVLVAFDVVCRVRDDSVSVDQALRSSLGLGKIGDDESGALGEPILLLDTNGRSLSQVYAGTSANAAVLHLTSDVIGEAVAESASDILIHPTSEAHFNVRYRVDGMLRTVRELSASESKSVINSIKAISGMDIAERRRPQDGVFIAKTTRGSISFRVATAGVLNGEKVSIRVLDQSASQFNLQNIGLAAAELRTITDLIAGDSGMVLVCGPTGSGKSSTVHAMLLTINREERNVITIEDPIEYVLPDASQIEINTKAGITFAKALRSVLRQDPDVISVGEIRDTETAETALQASQTGHLVFATVHSGSNTAALLRLIDLGIRPLLVASALNLVISQRLVRRLCDHCKAKASLTQEQRQVLWQQTVDPDSLFSPVGCEHCHGTGYSGRIGVFDLKVIDAKVKARLTQGDISIADKEDWAGPPGSRRMTMLQVQGTRLALAGITSWEEIQRLTTSIE
jgi:general secretion pathway protein E